MARSFATAPVLRARVEKRAVEADVVIAPLPDMRTFERQGRIGSGSIVAIGSVQAGVAVRDGVPDPDISSPDAFRDTVLDAHSLVCNQASSGLYIVQFLERLGFAGAVEAKLTRLPTGAAVLRHLAASRAVNEIGCAQIPEIRRFEDQGVRLVGPLPRQIGKPTTYAAGLSSDARVPAAAAAFVRFLGTTTAKRIFIKNGVA